MESRRALTRLPFRTEHKMSASDTQAPPEQEPPAASEQHRPAVHEQPISDDDEPQSERASGTERLDPHAEESPEDVIADRQRRRREALGATQDHPTSLIGDAGTPGTGAARTGADPRPPLRITDVPAVIAGARPAATRRTATGTASVAVAMRRRPASASHPRSPAKGLQAAAHRGAAAGGRIRGQPVGSTRRGVEELAEQVEQTRRALAQAERDNRQLRAAAARSEAELRRAERSAEDAHPAAAALFESSGSVAAIGAGLPRADAHLLRNLKGQVRELRRQLQGKEAELAELAELEHKRADAPVSTAAHAARRE